MNDGDLIWRFWSVLAFYAAGGLWWIFVPGAVGSLWFLCYGLTMAALTTVRIFGEWRRQRVSQ